ncbi:hypothetical protein B0J14DRAFT_671056 [Halenospora varia]|nr:hypothetical protein B0J14DRAFT_671056 [Halenospora varia]
MATAILAGCTCTFPGLEQLHAIAIRQPSTALKQAYTIKVGYFGMCISGSSQVASECFVAFGRSGSRYADFVGIHLSNKSSAIPEINLATPPLGSLAADVQFSLIILFIALPILIFISSFIFARLQGIPKATTTNAKDKLHLDRRWVAVVGALIAAVGTEYIGSALSSVASLASEVVEVEANSTFMTLQWCLVVFELLSAAAPSIIRRVETRSPTCSWIRGGGVILEDNRAEKGQIEIS